LGEFSPFYAIVHILWTVFEKYRNSPKIRATFSHGRSCVLVLTIEIGLGYVMGDFYTNSSGHLGRRFPAFIWKAVYVSKQLCYRTNPQ
jgi:hypothetical protein